MTRVSLSKASHVDETPTPQGGKTPLQIPLSEDDRVIRLSLGIYTIDVLPLVEDSRYLALARKGIEAPSKMRLSLQQLALFASISSTVRELTALQSSAWPLTSGRTDERTTARPLGHSTA